MGSKGSRRRCPVAKAKLLIEDDFGNPSVAERFPYLPDLLDAWAELNWHILFRIEPRGPCTFVHVWEDALSCFIKKFGDSCNM